MKRLKQEQIMTSTASGSAHLVVVHPSSEGTAFTSGDYVNVLQDNAFHPPKVVDKPFHLYQKGEPKMLGTAILFLGLSQIAFGIPVQLINLRQPQDYYAPFLCGIMMLVSGVLLIASARNPNKRIVTACLALNILGPLAGLISLVEYSASLNLSWWTRRELGDDLELMIHAVEGLLLFFCVCGAILQIVASSFACRGLRSRKHMPVIIMNNITSGNIS
ncbi:uncharacterized protein LOC102358781 isoform X1 [Latimeria chalumnae]|uniref:uncharacterized protein LOC102358781 isoform X1 n=1 Tax=Latimeria chalumnae TaxID=7897 RepID=UPI0003C14699|nr:PREDICTED: uncharacterized protein LOC102358781 [Latimeria chalumnae]|eukprot:XP_006002704.1 PREDICTED: uncharacterized protein LOC102358781 [Latimeria chalumnae]